MALPLKLNIVNVVTREHGEKFADGWFALSFSSGAITDACSDTEIIEWPYDGLDGDDLFLGIESEIAQRVCDQLRSAVVETFIRIVTKC
jgi:hypothetical protein